MAIKHLSEMAFVNTPNRPSCLLEEFTRAARGAHVRAFSGSCLPVVHTSSRDPGRSTRAVPGDPLGCERGGHPQMELRGRLAVRVCMRVHIGRHAATLVGAVW